jgi:glutathione S-transferase
MVRQVFSHRVFRPAEGRAGDEAVIAEGLDRSKTALAAIENLAAGGEFLTARSLSLADLHLGAMIAYFTAAAEGCSELARHPKLSGWWAAVSERPFLLRTDPGLPSP